MYTENINAKVYGRQQTTYGLHERTFTSARAHSTIAMQSGVVCKFAFNMLKLLLSGMCNMSMGGTFFLYFYVVSRLSKQPSIMYIGTYLHTSLWHCIAWLACAILFSHSLHITLFNVCLKSPNPSFTVSYKVLLILTLYLM